MKWVLQRWFVIEADDSASLAWVRLLHHPRLVAHFPLGFVGPRWLIGDSETHHDGASLASVFDDYAQRSDVVATCVAKLNHGADAGIEHQLQHLVDDTAQLTRLHDTGAFPDNP